MFAYAGQLPDVLRLFFLGRFYPLFGVRFGIFLRSAARHSGRPRVLPLRRFAALGVLHLLQPGEVLLPFAVAGLLRSSCSCSVRRWARRCRADGQDGADELLRRGPRLRPTSGRCWDCPALQVGGLGAARHGDRAPLRRDAPVAEVLAP